jgi:hypothetical protein
MKIPYGILQECEATTEELARRFDVSYEYRHVRDYNKSKDLPYHNWYHTMCMVNRCLDGANYHNLPYRSMRSLFVAALFHDYNHSGGEEEDSINIFRAINGLKNCGVTQGVYLHEVEEIIRVTEYPYVLEPVCIEHRIIRDADLMQGFFIETWEAMIIDGLREEMQVKLKAEITRSEMCLGQIEFLRKAVAHSKWGYSEFFEKENMSKLITRIRTIM